MPTMPGPRPAEPLPQAPETPSRWHRLTGWLRPDSAPGADEALGYESAQPHMAEDDAARPPR